ncbi:fused DSP-PTPase phosphatase/NAD kinase-like protein [Parvularcula maris]|uniref:Sulfur transferase domain-containing protein n=1 Tax=Parvularcula maris TaxID=2965077 RepID=A0A9X2L6T0_9PROT|nr:sulfur transferase domain-containing protein [Parvularcula maris]MCQ8184133.1 sulfur transferase domain-containing protein [Parvularcula maris]
MGTFLLPEEFDSPQGRRGAARSLWLEDHGFLRKVHRNEHEIGGGMWRSAQPSPGDIERLAARGFRTIINLRGLRNNERQPGFWHLEREAAAKHGIELVDLRAYSREAPKPQFIEEIDQLFRTIAYPALMHCKSGADRAGLGAFLYAFLKLGQPLSEAREQLSLRYGHIRGGKTGVLDHFIDTYEADARADGTQPNREHFLGWVHSRYDRDAVKASFEPQPLGSFLTETLLRRE